jgi:hypothetical protein
LGKRCNGAQRSIIAGNIESFSWRSNSVTIAEYRQHQKNHAASVIGLNSARSLAMDDLHFSEDAGVPKDRWQIETFFKTIKQNLKIKTFVGTTANAVKIQLWTALITILLLKMLKEMAKYGWSMSNLVAMLRFNLFTYHDLMQWLDDPKHSPPFVPDEQLALFSFGQHEQGACFQLPNKLVQYAYGWTYFQSLEFILDSTDTK